MADGKFIAFLRKFRERYPNDSTEELFIRLFEGAPGDQGSKIKAAIMTLCEQHPHEDEEEIGVRLYELILEIPALKDDLGAIPSARETYDEHVRAGKSLPEWLRKQS